MGAAGHGTGENLSDYYMEHFSLSPGRGGDEYGQYQNGAEYQIVGGGGGGVLINGEEPTRPQGQNPGHGYGGGGQGGAGVGLPGVVLIEVGP